MVVISPGILLLFIGKPLRRNVQPKWLVVSTGATVNVGNDSPLVRPDLQSGQRVRLR